MVRPSHRSCITRRNLRDRVAVPALLALLATASACRASLHDDEESDGTGTADTGDGDGDGDGIELIDNGDFERWGAGLPTSWVANTEAGHSLEQVSGDCHGGDACLRIDLGWDGVNTEYDQISQSIGPLPAGSTLVGSVWLREGGAVDTLSVGMIVNVEYTEPNAQGETYVTLPIREIGVGPVWTEASGTVEVPQEVSSAIVVLTAANGAFEYDDASLRLVGP